MSIATDETVEFDSTGSVANSKPRPVALVAGSSPGISTQIHDILQCRLRLAALVMFIGFLSFAVLNFFWPAEVASPFMRTLHYTVTITLGYCGISLCSKRPASTLRLRIKEVVVFGLPATFFAGLQYYRMSQCSREGYVDSPEAPWLLLMFTYALLIPNYWKRAAIVIGSMAAAPIAITLFLFFTDSFCQHAIQADSQFVATHAISLSLGAVIAVIGVRTIRQLRYEAFEAKQLGQYKLGKLIGRGGMGDVYLAEHQMMRRPCVVKVIQAERAGDPRSLARFEREVKATARLTHWNSIEVFDYGRTDSGTFYYVMEYLPGMNLEELVRDHGPLPAERAIHFLAQTCDALSEAHQRGLIHRDIKPANIFAAERGGVYDVAKLLDFGLVKTIFESPSDSDSIEMTKEGVITGSPLFMAPEQALEQSEPDSRSDIYALGAVAYFLVTGRPPFAEERPLQAILAHAREPVTPPGEFTASLPDDLEAVILRCLEKSPADRYQSADELGRALRTCMDAGGWTRDMALEWWSSSDPVMEVSTT